MFTFPMVTNVIFKTHDYLISIGDKTVHRSLTKLRWFNDTFEDSSLTIISVSCSLEKGQGANQKKGTFNA